MNTRKIFKTGHSIAVTIPKNLGLFAGDVVMVNRVSEGAIILTKVVRCEWMHPEEEED